MEKIICSAIKFQILNSEYFQIMCGLRHADVFELMFHQKIEYNRKTHIQGFLTSSDRFVDRYEAAEIALKSGQITDNSIRMLYSEDIWSE